MRALPAIALRSYMRVPAGTIKLQFSNELDQHQQTRLTPMKSTRQILLCGMLAAAVIAVAPSARAQQINGTPGSPDATVTIDGKQNTPTPMPHRRVRHATEQS